MPVKLPEGQEHIEVRASLMRSQADALRHYKKNHQKLDTFGAILGAVLAGQKVSLPAVKPTTERDFEVEVVKFYLTKEALALLTEKMAEFDISRSACVELLLFPEALRPRKKVSKNLNTKTRKVATRFDENHMALVELAAEEVFGADEPLGSAVRKVIVAWAENHYESNHGN